MLTIPSARQHLREVCASLARLDKDREALIGQVKADDQRVANLFAERTNMNARDVHRLFTKARTENADFALDHGFATAIREVEIPDGAPIISFAFNRQAPIGQ